MEDGACLYEVTDVKELHEWNCRHLDEHPMFELVQKSWDDARNGAAIEAGINALSKDHQICVRAMREGTDEAVKVIRNGGQIWHSIYRKKKANEVSESEIIQNFL